ncbi:hypothetical protein N9112_01215 [bacterium]|jgi:hypothetical protein|nr:hypothetical protein [bacterium]
MKKTQHKYTTIQQCIRLFTVLLLSGQCSHLYADEANDAFRFELTPYLWAASIKGTLAAEGGESPPVDSDYNFFALDNLDGVASTTFTARKNQWGFLFDFLYVAYEDTFLEASPLQITPRLEGTIIEFTGAYAPTSIDNLELIAGLRQQDITISLALVNRKPEQSASWIDAFAGIIYAHPLTGNFHISLRGDLGGFGIESDMAINAEAMFRYQMSDTFAIKFGYRYLKVKFKEDVFLYDISLDGFLFGLGIGF